MARESKAELTDRLRQEGRFEAFKKRREEIRATGTSAKQAWLDAATEFPPTDPPPASGAIAPKVYMEPLKDKGPISINEMTTWAVEYLDADWITPADAPSAGAWFLRDWARSSMSARSEFYRFFVTRMFLSHKERAMRAEDDRKRRRANSIVMNDIERLRR